MPIVYRQLRSPLGPLRLAASEEAVLAVQFATRVAAPCDWRPGDSPLLDAAGEQLAEYFAGRRQAFALPLQPEGSAFQQACWRVLERIPFGQTRSYAQQAQALGRPRALRAVGAANAANPLAILIPCHRVIGADGRLTGYGGGLSAKQWLIEHERRVLSAAVDGS